MGISYGFKVPAGPAQMEFCLTALFNSSLASTKVPVADTTMHDGTSAGHSQTQRTWLSNQYRNVGRQSRTAYLSGGTRDQRLPAARVQYRNGCGAWGEEGLPQRWLNARKLHCVLCSSNSRGRVTLEDPTLPVPAFQWREQ